MSIFKNSIISKILIASLLLTCTTITAQQNIRVMAYNVHNYPNGQDVHLKKIIDQINPDAVVITEMISQSGVNQFLGNSLTPDYKAATVTIRSSDSFGYNGNDCAFYYKSSRLNLIETKEIPARTRVISKFKLVHTITNDTLIILGVHLKANDYNGDNTLNEKKRADAVASMMNETKQYQNGANYLVCGDFNIFYSAEAAFQKMINKNEPGYFIDMMDVSGLWSNNPNFASISTHSTTDLDTRLDMILISPSLQTKGGIDYIENSFKIFGNDGNHFNLPVSYGVNNWFPTDPTIGVSLTQASDHLPIYADFQFGVPTDIAEENYLPAQFELKQNFPNPFNSQTMISYSIQNAGFVTLKIYDLLGREVTTLVEEFNNAGKHSLNLSMPASSSSGIYFYRLAVGEFTQTKTMMLLK